MDNDCRPSRSPASKTPPRRTDSSGSRTQNQLCIDDETLKRVMESFGPVEYSEFAATVSPQVLESLVSGGRMFQEESAPETGRRRSMSPRTDYQYVLPATEDECGSPDPHLEEAKRQTLLQWFDKSVEKELRKRREPDTAAPGSVVDPALSPLKAKHALNLSKGHMERLAEASASQVEISADLDAHFTTELTDAVEKLAKAEAMSTYAEALQAAEEAAQNAPPELVEQAAAEGARRIHAQITNIRDTVPGIRPIEVIGYVGVTKPYQPKKPQ